LRQKITLTLSTSIPELMRCLPQISLIAVLIGALRTRAQPQTKSDSVLNADEGFQTMDLSRVLRLSISAGDESFAKGEPCEIKITVANTGNEKVTLLKWGSPLDRISPMLGIFEVRDVETDVPVEMPVMKVSRKLPPQEEDLVEIGPGDSAQAIVKLPPFGLQSGHSYSIQAKGWWQAVWALPKETVISTRLQDISEGLSGSFCSEPTVVSLVRKLHTTEIDGKWAS
jgi:hypothetical protein